MVLQSQPRWTLLSSRGFDLTQIAFYIDGVPMGRNDNRGNRVSRFIDNENLLGVTVSQGSGDVSTPAPPL